MEYGMGMEYNFGVFGIREPGEHWKGPYITKYITKFSLSYKPRVQNKL